MNFIKFVFTPRLNSVDLAGVIILTSIVESTKEPLWYLAYIPLLIISSQVERIYKLRKE